MRMCGGVRWRVRKAVYFAFAVSFSLLAWGEPVSVSDTIDRLVFEKLDEMGLEPSEVCSDEVFLRRVYLDLCGVLPTEAEAREFLASQEEDKRAELIDHLLQRPEYADLWAMRWCDVLRVKSEFPSDLWPNGVQAYAYWIRKSLLDNMPYDRFARALLTTSGSNFRSPPVNFYRAVPHRDGAGIAEAVALTFLGQRIAGWPENKQRQVASFFNQVGYKKTSEWKEEIVYFDATKPLVSSNSLPPKFPDGSPVTIPEGTDPRAVFATWLVGSEDFSRAQVNRLWFWMFGRGIVHEADDFRPDNPPSNERLLDFLADYFRESGFDNKAFLRAVANSCVYQLSSVPNASNREDDTYFSHYYLRRLEAEVLIDAIDQVTGTTESYSSKVPEPFTWIPEKNRAVTLADGSITSPFLELFGRPPRDTGYLSERNNTISSAQRLHLLNSTHITRKLLNARELIGVKTKKEGSRKFVPIGRYFDEVEDRVYLTVLSRYPTPEEKAIIRKYLRDMKAQGSGVWTAGFDAFWALINSDEFLLKH